MQKARIENRNPAPQKPQDPRLLSGGSRAKEGMKGVVRTMTHFSPDLIAPCGMNCGVCSGYLAFTHNVPKKRGKITHCSGCRARPKYCAYLKGHCSRLGKGEVEFCYECSDFPCERLKRIDHRYRTQYATSFIRNLEEIRDRGMTAFLQHQRRQYTCKKCRKDVVSVHNGRCYTCENVTSWKSRRGGRM